MSRLFGQRRRSRQWQGRGRAWAVAGRPGGGWRPPPPMQSLNVPPQHCPTECPRSTAHRRRLAANSFCDPTSDGIPFPLRGRGGGRGFRPFTHTPNQSQTCAPPMDRPDRRTAHPPDRRWGRCPAHRPRTNRPYPHPSAGRPPDVTRAEMPGTSEPPPRPRRSTPPSHRP